MGRNEVSPKLHPTELSERCNVIEECYEYMLAYAGQGVSGEGDGHNPRFSEPRRASSGRHRRGLRVR